MREPSRMDRRAETMARVTVDFARCCAFSTVLTTCPMCLRKFVGNHWCGGGGGESNQLSVISDQKQGGGR